MSRQLGSSYVIEGSPIGTGATGSVYRGRDSEGHEFAFKVLHPTLTTEPGIIERFLKERNVLKDLRDPRLVQVRDFVAENDTLAIVMDLVDGPNLRDWANAHGPLTPSEVARIGAEAAAGLAVLHDAQVIHRDIKPENVLADESTAPITPRITDFGIASLIDSERTRSTVLTGTPQYMAPELFRGEAVTAAADMYSLGVMLYELACGVAPFVGTNATVMRGHLDLAPGRPGGIPPQLWDFISALLSKEPSSRPTAFEAATSLPAMLLNGLPAAPQLDAPPASQPVVHSNPTEYMSPSAPYAHPSAQSPNERSRLPLIVGGAAAAGGAVLAMVVGAAVVFGADRGSPSAGPTTTPQSQPSASPTVTTQSVDPSSSPVSDIEQSRCLDSSTPPALGDDPVASHSTYGDAEFSQSNVCVFIAGGYPQRSSLVYRGDRIEGPVTYYIWKSEPSEFQASLGFEEGSPALRPCTVNIWMGESQDSKLIKAVTVKPGVSQEVNLPFTGEYLSFDYGDCGPDPRRNLDAAGTVVIGTPVIRTV